jgi:hypothetical protein
MHENEPVASESDGAIGRLLRPLLMGRSLDLSRLATLALWGQSGVSLKCS